MVKSIDELDRNKLYSYADYLSWRIDERLELIKGKIFKMSPAPSTRHQQVSGRLFRNFSNYFFEKGCEVFSAPFDVRLLNKQASTADADVYTVVQPDISVVCDHHKLDRKGCLGAPDLIVEIISKSSKQKDVNEKFQLYQETGVKEYWIVQPKDALITIFISENGLYKLQKIYTEEERVQSGIFSDLTFELAGIFK